MVGMVQGTLKALQQGRGRVAEEQNIVTNGTLSTKKAARKKGTWKAKT